MLLADISLAVILPSKNKAAVFVVPFTFCTAKVTLPSLSTKLNEDSCPLLKSCNWIDPENIFIKPKSAGMIEPVVPPVYPILQTSAPAPLLSLGTATIIFPWAPVPDTPVTTALM